jgi:hypothetical protein
MRVESGSSPAVTRSPLAAPGSLSVMAMFGFAGSAVPIPFVPSAVLRRVRGALVHDVAIRHGLSLTEEARHEMSEPSRRAQGGALLTTVAFIARRTLRRIGLLGLLPPFASGLEVYALGLLFDRYLERVRSSNTLRVHGAEARLVRHAIDAAVGRAFSPSLEPRRRLGRGELTEELRPLSTRIFDGVLLGLAGVPDYVTRRLEAAFDTELEKDSFHV